MSFPNIPHITPTISLTTAQTIPLLLSSIAFEELALAHIVNAEAEKLQFVLGTLPPGKTTLSPPVVTISNLLDIDSSVQKTLRDVIKKEMLLEFKFENVLDLIQTIPVPPSPGSGVSLTGESTPAPVNGAPFPPAPIHDMDPNEDRGLEVPVGPFRGFVVPGSESSTNLLAVDLSMSADPNGINSDPSVEFFTYTPYGTVASPISDSAADVSGAKGGNVVLATGNWYAVYSTDGGNTFTSIDPTTVFPNTADGGFCCDQVVQYSPAIDRFIWLMQFSPGADGRSRLRIAAASPQDIIDSNCTKWTYWDITSDQLGVAPNTGAAGPLDYPDMSIGDNSLYVSIDAVGIGLLVIRIPLIEIQAKETIHFRFTHPSDSSRAYGGHLSQNTGDQVFWAGHTDNSTLQVFSWAENSDTYFWRDVNLKYNWPNGTISSTAPNEVDWLSKLGEFPGSSVLGATRRGNEVWFAWSASSGDGGHGGFSYPNAHIQVVRIDVANGYTLLDHFSIWNNDYAFAYPCLATNSDGEVGVCLAWGGNSFYGNSAVGFLGDFVVYYPELSDTAITRFGDYVTVRQASPEANLFAAFAYAVFNTEDGHDFDPFYILYGRPTPSPTPH